MTTWIEYALKTVGKKLSFADKPYDLNQRGNHTVLYLGYTLDSVSDDHPGRRFLRERLPVLVRFLHRHRLRLLRGWTRRHRPLSSVHGFSDEQRRAVKRLGQLVHCFKRGAAEVLGALLVMLDHSDGDAGDAGEVALGKSAEDASSLQA